MRELIWTITLLLVLSCSPDKRAERREIASVANGVTGTSQLSASRGQEPYALEISSQRTSRNSTVSLMLTGFDERDSKIEWLLNGTPVESSLANQFNLSQAKKGDILQARARVDGREVLSNTVDIANAPPEITTIKLLTDVTKPGDTVGVAVEGSDADGDTVTFLYDWTINRGPAGTGEKIGRPVKRGDSVVVKVTPYDGEHYGTSAVLRSEIQNMPPLIQEHGEFQFDGSRYAYQVKASDPDGDPLIYSIESPAEGMQLDRSSGLLTWNVPAEFKGRKNVPVVVTDGHGGTARYILEVNIQGISGSKPD